MSIETDSETRAEKFHRLAKKRMIRSLNAIRTIGNLSSNNYNYTAHEIELMRWTLIDQLDKTFAKFSRGVREPIHFDFPEPEIVEPGSGERTVVPLKPTAANTHAAGDKPKRRRRRA